MNDDDFDVDEALRMSRRKSVDSDSAKGLSKRNKVYQHIKKEIEAREKNKPKINAAEQVFFVDKQRNAAVVIGDRDLKTDVRNKKKRERSIIMNLLILPDSLE